MPVIFFGASVKKGHQSVPASPADVVPTLAALAHVPIAAGDGHVLHEAMASVTVTR